MRTAADARLTKVHVDLPNHPAIAGEVMWAVALGHDLYELRNVPFHAYDLNFGDIVIATPDSPELLPEIRKVVKRSGHRTLRVYFKAKVPQKRRLTLLQSLRFLATSFEGGPDRFFALDLPPEADILKVRAVLDDWVRKRWCYYETCELRVFGSFGDVPADQQV